MNTALFSYKRDVLKPGGLLSGKPELFAKLEEREVRPVVSLQGETAFLANQVEVNRLITDSTVESIGRTSLDSVGVVVNRLTRPFHMDEMPQEWQDSMPTVVNDNEFRLLAAYKDRVQTEILDPLGLGIPTRLIQNPVDIAIFMQEHPSTNYVVKPSNGWPGCS